MAEGLFSFPVTEKLKLRTTNRKISFMYEMIFHKEVLE
jgi:hypothetical protein